MSFLPLRIKSIMKSYPSLTFFTCIMTIFVGSTLTGCAAPSTTTTGYQPVMAQQGKDVIWVPTPNSLLVKMLETAQVTNKDLVYDLGAGDGKIAIEAARRYGARAVGIEFDPQMAQHARENAKNAGVADKVKIITGDIFAEDFSQATVVTLYLLPSLNLKLYPVLVNMKPGTRIVSNTFTIGSWVPDKTFYGDSGTVGHFWIVPANVQGFWRLEGVPGMDQISLSVVQKSQEFHADFTPEGKPFQRIDGRLNGTMLTFSYTDAQGVMKTFDGEVTGDTFTGTLKDDPSIRIVGKR
jgi:SAM-dependent methyltransferase